MAVKRKLLVGFTILILLVGNFYGYRTFKEVKQLKDQVKMDANYWIGMQ